MKTLYINAIVKLPDTFNGTYDEAVAYYLEARRSQATLPDVLPESITIAPRSEPFFLNQRYGFTMVSEGGVYALRHGSWHRVDKNPDVCYALGNAWIK